MSSEFVCDYCSRTFTRKYNLQTHIENCHINSSCYCEICDQRFGSPAGLQLHLSRGHNRFLQPYPECDLCGRVFTRKQNVVSHMVTVHLQGVGPQIQCMICFKTFTTERNLKRHMNQLHNPDVEYPTCDYCKKAFKGKHSLIAHIQATHNVLKDIIKCELCGKVYTNNRNLKRHIEMYHGEKEEFRCDLCPKVYTSNQSLRRHARTRHNTEERCDVTLDQDNDDLTNVYVYKTKMEFPCIHCEKHFSEEPMLRQHIKTEHSFKKFYEYCKSSLLKQMGKAGADKVLYNCEGCNSTFNSVYELKDHMRASHDREYSLSTCNVCFAKFFSKESMFEHKKLCLPPPNVNACSHCDKLFTDVSSLEFHVRIFHPQAQIADNDVTSTNHEDATTEAGSFKCVHCDRMYYSDRSLKHHVKLKHTTDEAVDCGVCGKMCSNKYYLASHIKIVHNNDSWSKCDYCEKQFKSKRNIRRHIEYTHLGMQRYKCIECETLFKEKRSLRKHVRTKHPNSTIFPQCHICYKRFESAKSCKIHLKLLHSFNMNTYPCDLCSVSFSSKVALNIHLETKHLAEDQIFKCEPCNLVFNGQDKFEQHNEICHVNLLPLKQKLLPRCVICMKDFSTRKTLKRHIKKFHNDFDPEELATYGSKNRMPNVECEECLQNLNDDFYYDVYEKLKHLRDSVIFTCSTCSSSYDCLEYSVQRYKLSTFEGSKTKMILSELCTAEMSDEGEASQFGFECMEPESTTGDMNIKVEPMDYVLEEDIVVKDEPLSP